MPFPKRLAAYIGLSIGVLLSLGCGGSRPEPEVGAAKERAFLWRATHPERPGQVLHLFGSVHLGTADFYPLDPVIEDAFERADALVVEIALERLDPTKVALAIAKRALLPPGETLRDRIDPTTWEHVRAALERHGMPEQMVLPFKPWYAALTLLTARLAADGFSAEQGIDRHFVERARGRKEILELETVDLQLGLFDGMSAELQELMLLDAVVGELQSGGAMDGLIAAWRAGDADALDAEIRATMGDDARFAPLYDSIIIARNHTMTDKMVELLGKHERLFVVVGAGHLVGAEGAPKLLEARGWQVEQLRNERP